MDAYQRKFVKIPLLQEDRHMPVGDFDQHFLPVNVQRLHKPDAQWEHQARTSRNIKDLWWDEMALQTNRIRRMALEGPAGSGKTTLCRHMARQQCWPELFPAVLYLNLPKLVRQFNRDCKGSGSSAASGGHEIDLQSLVQIACQCIGALQLADRVFEFLSKNTSGQVPLLIFDGFNEVEHLVEERSAVGRFLTQLLDNRLEAVYSCLLVSRFEKRLTMKDCVRLEPKEWEAHEVQLYINTFFNALLSFKTDQTAQRKLIAQDYLLQRNKTSWSPLFCELVCSVLVPEGDGGGGFGLTELFGRFEWLLWERWGKRQQEENNRHVTEAEKGGKQALLGKVALDQLFHVDKEKANIVVAEQLADSGFFAKNPGKSGFSFQHKSIRDYAAARYMFATQLATQPSEEALHELLRNLMIGDLQRQKVFLIFLALMLQKMKRNTKQDGVEGGRAELLLMALTEAFLRKYKCERQEMEMVMAAKHTDSEVRNHWAKELNVDVVVDVVTALDHHHQKGGYYSTWFLNKIQPKRAKVGPLRMIAGAKMTATYTPWIYHLIIDQAARSGNQTIVTRLCLALLGRPEFLKHPLLEAYASHRGTSTMKILQDSGAPQHCTLSLALQFRCERAALKRLRSSQLSKNELAEACRLLVQSHSELHATIIPEILQSQTHLSHVDNYALSMVSKFDLFQVNLSKCMVNDTHCELLTTALVASPSVQSWNLSTNLITDVGARLIANALKVNRTLTTLCLNTNGITGEGSTAIAEALRCNISLTHLDLSLNRISEAGCWAFVEPLKQNTTLSSLDLSSNIDDEDQAIMLEAAFLRESLTVYLHCTGNPGVAKKSFSALVSADDHTYDVFLCHRGSDREKDENVKEELAVPLYMCLKDPLRVFLDKFCLKTAIPSFGMLHALLTCHMGVIFFSRGFIDGVFRQLAPWCTFELRILWAKHQWRHYQEAERLGFFNARPQPKIFGIAVAPFTIDHCFESPEAEIHIPLISHVELELDQFVMKQFRRELEKESPKLLEFMDDPTLTLKKLLTGFPVIPLESHDEQSIEAMLVEAKRRINLSLPSHE